VRVLSSARRGSSWPIEVGTEAGPYFLKLAGGGNGLAALVAEIIVAEIAEAIELRVPVRALVTLDADIESEDRDPELLDLLRASQGLNLGLETVAGARAIDAGDIPRVSSDEAARIVWLDWLVLNPDRTPSNPNLLIRRGQLWLIDHGAALVFHHNWPAVTEASPHQPWPLRDHLLMPRANSLRDWDPVLSASVRRDIIDQAVSNVPDAFLHALAGQGAREVARRRAAYAAFLWKRLRSPNRPA